MIIQNEQTFIQRTVNPMNPRSQKPIGRTGVVIVVVLVGLLALAFLQVRSLRQPPEIDRVASDESKAPPKTDSKADSKAGTKKTSQKDVASIQTANERRPTADKPNIIVINLDDADLQMLSPDTMSIYFPNIRRFADEGIRFTNMHVTTPLCGPSRAAFFSSRYSHNNGIRTNDPLAVRSNGFEGGMRMYGRYGHHQNDVSVWMKSAGYRTMMIGKYLHGETVDLVPEGWDDFYSSFGANYFGTARFTNKDDPQGEYSREDVTTYRTVQESSEAIQLIETHVDRNNQQPFFLYFAPLAPHHHAPQDPRGMVEEKYKQLWPNAQMPLSESHLEADFSDKSTAIRDIANMTEKQNDRLTAMYRNRMRSIKSIDDMFAKIFMALEENKIDDSTYIFLTSDNGFSLGHHRMIGKGDSFHQSTNVPTYVIGPGVSKGVEANHLLAHIDIAPTVLELAGGKTPDDIDGKSFAPLLKNSAEYPASEWRDAILIENWETRVIQSKVFNTAGIGIRFYDTSYCEWANGSAEYYDLNLDPHQVDNVFDSLTDQRKQELAAKLKEMYRRTDPDMITTISHPFAMDGVLSRNGPIVGMAESGDGVSEVLLAIRRHRDSKYWNGDSWQYGEATLNAELTNPNQILTTWNYDQVPQGEVPGELLQISAYTISSSGKVDDDSPAQIFQLDYTPPTTELRRPVNPYEVQALFQIGGQTNDNETVEKVLISIRNKTDDQYWNGTEWSEDWASIEAPVKNNGRFSLRLPQFHGNFLVSVRAVDRSGNVQSTALTFPMSVALPEGEGE